MKAKGVLRSDVRAGEKVVAAFPHGHEVSARFFKCWDALRQYDFDHNQRICDGGGLLANASGANVTNARNEIVAKFLGEHDAAWLWFWDTDMTGAPDLLDRLLASADPVERPIMGALCFSLQATGDAKPTLYTMREDGTAGGLRELPSPDGIWRVMTGAGCLLIHRSALVAMGAKYGQMVPAYPWFMESYLGHLPVGEDLTFCVRAEAMGIPVHVDTTIECGHEKPFVVDRSMWEAQQQARRAVVESRRSRERTPVVVGIPVKDRHELTANLIAHLEPQLRDDDEILVLDNGSDVSAEVALDQAVVDTLAVFDTTGENISTQWNRILAEAQACGFHAVILNNDIEVGSDFLDALALALDDTPDAWIACPADKRGMTGWAFAVHKDCPLTFDEQFEWWCGEDDFAFQVASKGKGIVQVQVECRHLHPNESTYSDPERLTLAGEDQERFRAKWGRR